jgi:hypothetical protein
VPPKSSWRHSLAEGLVEGRGKETFAGGESADPNRHFKAGRGKGREEGTGKNFANSTGTSKSATFTIKYKKIFITKIIHKVK